MSTTTKIKWIGIIWLTCLLTACFGWGNKQEDESTHYYVIDVERGTIATHFASNKILRIRPVRMTSHFRNKNLVLRVGQNEYLPIEHHQFFSSPDEMFTEQLKRWLQKSGLFSEVIIDEDKPSDYVLESAVTALYGEGRPQFSSQAVLEMQFFLLDGHTDSSKVLFQTGLRTEVDVEEMSPPSLVKGWKTGLKEIISTFDDDLSNYFSKVTTREVLIK